jgi:hypothetical protein
MPKSIQKAALICLLVLQPVIGTGQTCQTASIPATTPSRQFTINNNGTVTDTKSGLMRKRCSEGYAWNGTACRGSGAKFTWREALQRAQTHNGTGFAGFKDWRLPNVKELFSIVEKQCDAPTINLAIFPNTDSNMTFWSSSPYFYRNDGAGNVDTGAWYIVFYSGIAQWGSKDGSDQVRLVRSGQ